MGDGAEEKEGDMAGTAMSPASPPYLPPWAIPQVKATPNHRTQP